VLNGCPKMCVRLIYQYVGLNCKFEAFSWSISSKYNKV
jgi:hypothetical protein